ncbi:acyltransferase family protein [Maribacter sp. LLG6340-A2]|uniref:acyltransferase family protein n=1 Tax=Maribacter sp. LLG6340-A2 TaxID=3160834 RepID=UPI00386A8C90
MAVKQRIYQIDLLRFVAAVGIMLVHYLYRGFKADNLTNLSFLELAGEWVKYCAVFIDLFFIISGFVITLSVANKSVTYFFKSRVVRLFSVYWLCAFITYLVTIFYGAPRFTATFGQFLFNLTLLQDFFDIERLDGAYWTMSVELRFYALALGYLILYRYKKIKVNTIAYIWLGLTVIYPLVQNIFIFKVLNLFLMFQWSPAFIAGMLMADIYKSKTVNLKNGIAIGICFILSCFHRLIYAKMAMVIYNETFSEPVIFAVMFSAYGIMLLVILGGLKWMNKPYFLYLGIMTYPLYLLHQRIGYIIFNNLMGYMNKYVILIGTITLMITASFIIVRYIAGPLSNFMEKYLGKVIDFILGIKLRSSSLPKSEIENIPSKLSDK